jgi:uncharacterized protein (DUF1697 family)
MTYVALLRGINVGGNNQIKMADLKATFERLGLKSVKTVIASGNVIFQSGSKNEAKLTKDIEKAIQKDFKADIKVLLKNKEQLGKLVKAIPTKWVNDDKMKCDVMFLWSEIDKASTLKEFQFNPKIEDLKYVPGAVLWRIDRKNASKSRIFKIVGTKLHKQMTVRNPNTVRKLYALMSEK